MPVTFSTFRAKACDKPKSMYTTCGPWLEISSNSASNDQQCSMISDSKNCSSTPVTLKLRASKKTDPIKSNRDASVIVIVLHHKVWLLQRKELDINIFRQGILTLQLTLLQNICSKQVPSVNLMQSSCSLKTYNCVHVSASL